MNCAWLKGILGFFAFAFAAAPLPSQELPKEYQEVLTYLGRKGDFKANVLKVNIPRNDLLLTIVAQPTPTPFGFSGWLAMSKGMAGWKFSWATSS